MMDLGEQADRVKFMIRGRGSNFTAAFDTILADAGIRTVLGETRTGHHQLAGAPGHLRCDEMAPGGSLHPGRDR